jgi:hypothetical protein
MPNEPIVFSDSGFFQVLAKINNTLQWNQYQGQVCQSRFFQAFDFSALIAEIIVKTCQGVSLTRLGWDLPCHAIISKSPEAGFGWEYFDI